MYLIDTLSLRVLPETSLQYPSNIYHSWFVQERLLTEHVLSEWYLKCAIFRGKVYQKAPFSRGRVQKVPFTGKRLLISIISLDNIIKSKIFRENVTKQYIFLGIFVDKLQNSTFFDGKYY